MPKELPIDEYPDYKRHRTGILLAINLAAAVFLGISLAILGGLQDRALDYTGNSFQETHGFANAVMDEAGREAEAALTSELKRALTDYPDEAPIPIGFGEWGGAAQRDYLTRIAALPQGEWMSAARRLENQVNSAWESESDAVPASVFYKKSDLVDWSLTGIQHRAETVITSDGTPPLFVCSGDEEKLRERVGTLSELSEQIFSMLIEEKRPLNVASVYEAADLSMETYDLSAHVLDSTLRWINLILTSGTQRPNAPTNVEVTIQFDETKGAVYSNAVRVSDEAVWSAPIYIEDAVPNVGSGPWSKELRRNGSFQSELQTNPIWKEGVHATIRVDTKLHVNDALAQRAVIYPQLERLPKIVSSIAVVSALIWMITLGLGIAWTTNVRRPLLRRVEGLLPIELYIVLALIFAGSVIAFVLDIFYSTESLSSLVRSLVRKPLQLDIWGVMIVVCLITDFLGWAILTAFFRKARQGRFIEGSITKGIIRFVHKQVANYRDGSTSRHRLLLGVFLWFVCFGFSWFLVLVFSSPLLLILPLLVAGVPFIVALRKDAQQSKIFLQMGKVVRGEAADHLDPESFDGAEKEMALEINQFDQSLQSALERSLKNERLQAELITNVSHDLRTPLTSIITYVDLLQQPELSETERQEYLEVLAKKAKRLKTLMNDLIDVSKASSGMIDLQMEPMDFGEVVRQSVAEMESGWEKEELIPVMTWEEGEWPIVADGQKLSRVLENLISNAQKYSQPHTRVYLDLYQRGQRVIFTLKNVSRFPLNMTPEELVERFNRGDKSRITEGSGLGLSISDQLTRQMGGNMKLSIDGDLFKVDLSFLLEQEDASSAEAETDEEQR